MARSITFVWILLIGVLVTASLANPALFSHRNLIDWLSDWGPWSFALYALIATLRGVVLLPSTPVILAGGILFSEHVFWVFAVNLLGAVVSASVLFRFPGGVGYDMKVQDRYPERINAIRKSLSRPYAVWAVAAWAVQPLVPTETICYAAGLVKMSFTRLLVGILIGNTVFVGGYLYVAIAIERLVA